MSPLPLALFGLLVGGAPGHFDGYAALDHFSATSTDGASSTPYLRGHEVGISTRLLVQHGDYHLQLDYRGREPTGGDLRNDALRLLYRASLSAQVTDALTLALGRLMAAAPVFLPVDGVMARWQAAENLSFEMSLGRRAISTSRQVVDFNVFLPAAAFDARYQTRRFGIGLAAAYAQDLAVQFAATPSAQRQERFAAPSARVHAFSQATEGLRLYTSATVMKRATYRLGPSFGDLPLQVEALDVFSALAGARHRIASWLMLRYDFLFQRSLLAHQGGAARVVDPRFSQHRLGSRFFWRRIAEIWADYRVRLRQDRIEHRPSLRAAFFPDFFYGLALRGFYGVHHMQAVSGFEKTPNRSLWAASIAYQGGAFEVEAGASFIERDGAASSRSGTSGAGADLSPFALRAEKVLFARNYLSFSGFFGGIDLERNIDANEFRLLVQLGTHVETAW